MCSLSVFVVNLSNVYPFSFPDLTFHPPSTAFIPLSIHFHVSFQPSSFIHRTTIHPSSSYLYVPLIIHLPSCHSSFFYIFSIIHVLPFSIPPFIHFPSPLFLFPPFILPFSSFHPSHTSLFASPSLHLSSPFRPSSASFLASSTSLRLSSPFHPSSTSLHPPTSSLPPPFTPLPVRPCHWEGSTENIIYYLDRYSRGISVLKTLN